MKRDIIVELAAMAGIYCALRLIEIAAVRWIF